jgi:linear primary-alkylsulfatase
VRPISASKNLLADTLEQLGYQAESGPWRNVYLQAAYELRNGVPDAGGVNSASPDTIRAMPPYMLFDFLAVRLNGERAAGKKIALNVNFTDLSQVYALTVENGVLNTSPTNSADATITLTKTTLDNLQLGEFTLEDGTIKVDSKKEAFTEFLGLLDTILFGSIS